MDQQEEKLFECPSAGKDCFVIVCSHFKRGHIHSEVVGETSIKGAGCPACIPIEPKKPYNHLKQFANCKTCEWQGEVCCSYESECDGTSHYEPKKPEGEKDVCTECQETGTHILKDEICLGKEPVKQEKKGVCLAGLQGECPTPNEDCSNCEEKQLEKEKCPECKGKKEVMIGNIKQTFMMKTCPTCKGTGLKPKIDQKRYEYIHMRLYKENPKTNVWGIYNNRTNAWLGWDHMGLWLALLRVVYHRKMQV